MTSFAFIAGLIPLVVATGAGAISNRTIGTAAAGGMLVGTVMGVLVIPGLYYLFARFADGRKLLRTEVDEPLSELFEHGPLAAENGDGENGVHAASNGGDAAAPGSTTADGGHTHRAAVPPDPLSPPGHSGR
jgi:HAE1 family hydrophobic/amphiphilic exporter-1